MRKVNEKEEWNENYEKSEWKLMIKSVCGTSMLKNEHQQGNN